MDWLLCDKDLHHERVTLKTGKQAFKTIETYFLTTLKKRISKRDIFMEKCQKRGDRSEELNKKKKIKFQTFFKTKKSIQASKIQRKMNTWHIWSTSTFSNTRANRCDKKKFPYPLVPESSCFCYPDGSLCDSPKSKVFHYLKNLTQSDNPLNNEAVIANRMFLVMLTRRLKQANHWSNICFDVYESPSI